MPLRWGSRAPSDDGPSGDLMTSHALHRRASARTRTFALAVALALAASMLATSPAAGSSAIERTGSLDLGVTGTPRGEGGFALSDGTHAYFGYHSEGVGRIEKVHIDNFERVDVPTAQNFTVDPNFGWTSAAIHGDFLYLGSGNNAEGRVRKVNKNTLQLVGPEFDLPAVTTAGGSANNFTRPLAAYIDAVGVGSDDPGEYGYFAAKEVTQNRVGIFKVKLADMTASAFRQLNFDMRIGLDARGEGGVFDDTHGYLVSWGAFGETLVVAKFALADITYDPSSDGSTFNTNGQIVPDTVDLRQSGHLSTDERVCSLVADADHLYAASCIPGAPQPGGAGRVTKVNKGTLALVSTTEIATPSNISSAVIDGADAYFIGARVTKVATNTMAVVSTTDLCSGEDVRASVLAPGGDLLLNVRAAGIARVVRVGAGSRAACPDGSGTSGGSGSVAEVSAADRASSVAVAAASAAGVAGSSSAVLVRRGEVVPVTSGSASGAGPRGGVVLEAEGLKVMVAAAGGASPQTGVVAPVGGEIVCEVCAELAAGSTVEAWMYSSPQLVAAVRVPDDHEDGDCVLLRIPVGEPLTGDPIAAGAHTLQLRLTTVDGIEVLATGVTVGTAVPSRVPAGEGPAGRGLLGVFGLLAVAGAVALRRLAVTG